jgi:glutathione-independent formaldehyde dehydrogenase
VINTWSAAGPQRRLGLVLGHEITGEVVEVGPDVEFIKTGDLCSVPFNIACGRCRNCKEGKTGVCLNVNPDRPVRRMAR